MQKVLLLILGALILIGFGIPALFLFSLPNAKDMPHGKINLLEQEFLLEDSTWIFSKIDISILDSYQCGSIQITKGSEGFSQIRDLGLNPSYGMKFECTDSGLAYLIDMLLRNRKTKNELAMMAIINKGEYDKDVPFQFIPH